MIGSLSVAAQTSPGRMRDLALGAFEQLKNRLNYSTDLSLQVDAASFARNEAHMYERIRDLKASEGDAKRANAALVAKVLLDGVQAELEMWIQLKKKRYESAWAALVKAQDDFAFAAQHYPEAPSITERAEHLKWAERLLFRTQIFVSPGLIVQAKDVECSICGATYGTCNHLAGELINGQICYKMVNRIHAAREVSVVARPTSKMHRFLDHFGVDAFSGLSAASQSRNQARAPQGRAKRKRK
jgi:hypothetical protein